MAYIRFQIQFYVHLPAHVTQVLKSFLSIIIDAADWDNQTTSALILRDFIPFLPPQHETTTTSDSGTTAAEPIPDSGATV